MALIPVVGGSISYTAPAYTYGQTSQQINGGYSFDLPLATVQAFTNTALTFSAQNTSNAQGFLSGIIGTQQAALTNVNNQSFAYQDKSLTALQSMFKSKLKKEYGAMNMLKPGSQCFITTAICKAANLPDDTWQLMLLRKFRDEQLANTEEGQALIDHYYRVAPAIVEGIDNAPNAAAFYSYIEHNFLGLAIRQISVGDYAGATGTYAAMVEVARKHAGIIDAPVVESEVEEIPATDIGDETGDDTQSEFLGD